MRIELTPASKPKPRPAKAAVDHRLRVLVVTQTPPPYYGQAVIGQKLLEGKYRDVELSHVRMAYSKELDDVGRFQPSKLLHLAEIICKTIYRRFRNRADVLYYAPAGPNMVPMIRDLIFLIATRWLFRKTIFHFHAAGISELYARLPAALRVLFRAAYFEPDLAVIRSELNPPDAAVLRAKRTVVVPGGMADYYPRDTGLRRPVRQEPIILFVGVLRESKGVMVLLEACKQLRNAGVPFKARLMGSFGSTAFQKEVASFIEAEGLGDRVELLGVLTGQKKWDAYADADILCFPTFFESESFGLVLVEAMQFELPVVTTLWRGIPSIVEDGSSGFLVPIKDPGAVSEKLAVLIRQPELRAAMGARGRSIYLDRYDIRHFWSNMEAAFKMVQ
jgi:glycosyltransferase involved in cell wall biosynthesis